MYIHQYHHYYSHYASHSDLLLGFVFFTGCVLGWLVTDRIIRGKK